MFKNALLVFLLILSSMSLSAEVSPKNPQMKFMGAYDAGQPGVYIYKLFDPTEDVVCYALMPEAVGRRKSENGKWIYDGNSVGSISCLKVKLSDHAISSNGRGM